MRIYYFGELIADTKLMSEVAGARSMMQVGDVIKARADYDRFVINQSYIASEPEESITYRGGSEQCYA